MEFEIKDGKGNIKEFSYYDGTLKFEGEYLNGERNGKGKEYLYEGLLKFEREYIKGEIKGKDKEYNYVGLIEFEEENLNGNRIEKNK